MFIEEWINSVLEKNANGTLTVKEAPIGNYYRLMNGKYAGRVIVRTHSKINEKNICWFANGLTWVYEDNIKDCLCEISHPIFSDPIKPIDYSQASWYSDSGILQHHEW